MSRVLALFFERTHRVLLSRYSGVLTSDDIDITDRAVLLFMGRQGPVRGILDFSDVDSVEASRDQLAERARQPQMAAGQQRLFVVNKPHLLALAQSYVMVQQERGIMAPRIVPTLAAATALLGMPAPRFEPVEIDTGDRVPTA